MYGKVFDMKEKQSLDEFLTRGVEKIYPSKEEFLNKLSAGPITIYFGIDPTSPFLHIGHGSILLKLKQFQGLGHKITILFGDFTARIGDPDKKDVRKILTEQEVKANLRQYKKQVLKVLDPWKTKFVYNSKWLKKLNFEDVLGLASEFTVGQMIERDMFQRRIKEGNPIYLQEFLYPLMQGYDSVALGVDAEIGGNDQTFNMLTGRQMMKRRGKEKFVVAMKLLVDSVGNKMGKSEGNMVTLDDSADEMFGKVMSWPDHLMPLAFEICTDLDTDVYQAVLAGHPKEAKKTLARSITTIYYDEKKALEAEEKFDETFSKKNAVDVPEMKIKKGEALVDVLIGQNLIKSKTEFARLVSERAIKKDGVGVADPRTTVEETAVYKIGKHRFVKLVV